MEVCKAYMEAQANWKRRYAELERREREAELDPHGNDRR